MRHRLMLCTLACLGVALPAAPAAAQFIPKDGIYIDNSLDKPRFPDFVIASESPQALFLKSPKGKVPAEKIVDIVFPLKPATLHLSTYRQAIIAEKLARRATKPAERTKGFADALAKYEETLQKLDPDQPYVQAHLRYKVADLLYLQGRDENKEESLQKAMAKLKEFGKEHPKAWQLVRVLRMLAQLQLDRKEYAAAEQTYHDLAKADVSADVRDNAAVQALLVAMQAGAVLQDEGKKLEGEKKAEEGKAKLAEAQKQFAAVRAKLQALIGKLRGGSPQQLRARLALAECLGVGHDLPKAKAEVKTVLDQATADKALRGLAYATMGYCYYVNEQWQDARWEFLWVDTIYNQDAREHAKALYYLADIFARLGDGDRARECREQLLNGPRFNGLDYQRRARREEKQ
jgi:hypothetical protein